MHGQISWHKDNGDVFIGEFAYCLIKEGFLHKPDGSVIFQKFNIESDRGKKICYDKQTPVLEIDNKD